MNGRRAVITPRIHDQEAPGSARTNEADAVAVVTILDANHTGRAAGGADGSVAPTAGSGTPTIPDDPTEAAGGGVGSDPAARLAAPPYTSEVDNTAERSADGSDISVEEGRVN